MGQIKNIKLHIVTDIKYTVVVDMGYLEVRHAGSWNGACQDIVAKLKQYGFYKGQIWGVDAHVNDPNGDAIISVHWSGQPSGPYNNQAYLDYEMLNDNNSWDQHYKWGDNRADELRRAGKRIISLTHSNNCSDRGVSIIWFEH